MSPEEHSLPWMNITAFLLLSEPCLSEASLKLFGSQVVVGTTVYPRNSHPQLHVCLICDRLEVSDSFPAPRTVRDGPVTHFQLKGNLLEASGKDYPA